MTLRDLALAATLAAATCTPSHPVLAQGEPAPAACAAYSEMTETLRRRFCVKMGFSAEEERGITLEFFANADGNWTLVIRRDGQACAIAAGTAWRAEPQGSL